MSPLRIPLSTAHSPLTGERRHCRCETCIDFAYLTGDGGRSRRHRFHLVPLRRFTPDVPGIYKLDLIVGNDAGKSPMASVKIQAGEYVGFEKGGCSNCHSQQAANWAKTGHATKVQREIDGGADPQNSHYGEGCIRCHTTGYYVGVENGGFADVQAKLGWKFPSLASIQSGRRQRS